ncbi:MAG: type IV secretory system conjugative DNA transfer family protein [Francisellaceae bacterium]
MIDHGMTTLESLGNLSNESAYYQKDDQSIRLKAVKEAAISLGAQSGLYYESGQIEKFLNRNGDELDTFFNFNMLLIGDVLPPVIDDAKGSVKVSNDAKTIHAAGNVYAIIKQVRFVTAPPTWRSYFDSLSVPKPDMPNSVLLPKDENERKIWQQGILTGWSEGIKQAITIYRIDLNTLVRDYTGMLLYERLLTEGLISSVYVKSSYSAIVGDKNKVSLGNRQLMIKDEPQLLLKSNLWQPVVSKS